MSDKNKTQVLESPNRMFILNPYRHDGSGPTLLGGEVLAVRGDTGLTNHGSGGSVTYAGGMGTSVSDSLDAFDFSVSTKYMDAGNGSGLIFGTSNFSMAAWIKPTSLSSFQIIFGKDVSGARDWVFGLSAYTANKLFFASVSASDTDGRETISSVPAGWVHVGVSYTRGSVPSLYINGSAITTTASPGTDDTWLANFNQTNKVLIGRREFASFNQPFVGLMDDMRISSSVWTATNFADLASSRRY